MDGLRDGEDNRVRELVAGQRNLRWIEGALHRDCGVGTSRNGRLVKNA